MRWLGLSLAICLLAQPALADVNRGVLDLTFVPTGRAQIAVWVERDDGTMMATLALTHAVAVAGIGNRPGALQMNSGFRWPYGRREGVLPVWAHRRAEVDGAKLWKRVIFQKRDSEGYASRTSNDQSVDDYYCLSFDQDNSGRDALDAVTCASIFSSDKGRFITSADVNAGYAEPWEDAQQRGSMRPLDLWSLYPPRRDVSRCTGASSCYDHPDVDAFKSHAVEVMPELDAITRATPAGEQLTKWQFSIPADWDTTAGYTLFIEANVEGDYNPSFDDKTFKTPKTPAAKWDSWAISYGYAYRGQPSIVFAVPFRIDTPNETSSNTPAGYGDLEGATGELKPMTSAITDDPSGARGSGADRLLSMAGGRATVKFSQSDPCSLPVPPPECGMTCLDNPEICGDLICGEGGTCQSVCSVQQQIPQVQNLEVREYPEANYAHMWGVLSFVVPPMSRPYGGFDVAVRPLGGEWKQASTHDAIEKLLPVALNVCADPGDPMRNRCPDLRGGEQLSFDLTELRQNTDYEVRIIIRDGLCNVSGDTAIATFRTPARVFTTVSPCFIATATYGSPLAQEIGVLRTFRDRYLAPHAPGRALIALYYGHGPKLASWVATRPWLRSLTRTVLDPVVDVVDWWLH
jgi:hypothetical protein